MPHFILTSLLLFIVRKGSYLLKLIDIIVGMTHIETRGVGTGSLNDERSMNSKQNTISEKNRKVDIFLGI